MTSAAQLMANYLNAQHSTGPRTEEGKAASSRNRFVHGLSGGRFAILLHESTEKFEQLEAAFIDEHQPQTITESVLVKAMTESWWLRNRAQHYQELCLGEHQADDPEGLPLYIRYQAHHDRVFHRALADLLKLRAAREKSELQKIAAAQRQELLELRIESARLKVNAQQAKLDKLQPKPIAEPIPQIPLQRESDFGFVPQPDPESTPFAEAA